MQSYKREACYRPSTDADTFPVKLMKNAQPDVDRNETRCSDQSIIAKPRTRRGGKASCEGIYRSSAHSFSRRICSSSSGVKSLVMLNVLRISSGDLPLIMFATVLQPRSRRGLMSR